jgi:hypothetical protein
MGSLIQLENYDVRGPRASLLFNVAITTSSQAIDLNGANYASLLAAIQDGRMVTLQADGGKVWYRWGTATGTVDETKTAADTPANQGAVLAADERRDERPPGSGTNACTWLIVKGQVACTLRIYVSSVSPSSFVGA